MVIRVFMGVLCFDVSLSLFFFQCRGCLNMSEGSLTMPAPFFE